MDDVKVSIEKLLEREIDEISHNGEEKYIKPLSLSEELTYLAGKIDFYEGFDKAGDGEPKESNDNKNEESAKDSCKESNQWHWESVHSKLRIALSEVSVMLDVLHSLNRKKYLVLDPIQQNAEPNKQTVQTLEKRKYLARAGNIIAKGAISLQRKSSSSPLPQSETKGNEYYMQLMRLRQYWNVKKVGNVISGNLSYKSAGSKFWHPGLFEVQPEHDGSDKKIAVNISADLKEKSFISVELHDNESNTKWKNSDLKKHFSTKLTGNLNWNLTLREAQCHLFNKEIFALIGNNAFQGNFIGISISNKVLSCRILDEATVTVKHVIGNMEQPADDNIIIRKYTNDLLILLSNLLLKYHSQNSQWSNPAPSTSNNYQKLNRSSSIHNLTVQKQFHQSMILEEFLREAEFKTLLNRVIFYLEDKTKRYNDTFLFFHINNPIFSLKASITIILHTKFNDQVKIMSLSLFVSLDEMVILTENLQKFTVPPVIKNLDEIISFLICRHLLYMVSEIGSYNNWREMSIVDNFIDLNQNEHLCLSLFNVQNKQKVLFKVKNVCELEVSISDKESRKLWKFLDQEFNDLAYNLKNINWLNVPGESFIKKCIYLLLL